MNCGMTELQLQIPEGRQGAVGVVDMTARRCTEVQARMFAQSSQQADQEIKEEVTIKVKEEKLSLRFLMQSYDIALKAARGISQQQIPKGLQ